VIKKERYIFTLDYYEEFLNRLREAYSFTTFQEGKTITKTDKPLAIIRHDIDMDLEAALRMSLIETRLGISATYFFMVRCPLYNVFSSSGEQQVRQILAVGHHLGLHFDCALYEDISEDNLNYYISRECELLEQFFGYPVEAISFHRPGRLELSGVELDRWPNSYERIFLEKFEYFSDSRGNWARGNPLESEAFSRRKNLHLCMHPIWWSPTPMTPYECLVNLVQRIGQQAEQYISENCQVWNEGKQLK
jgi:hypothetical protein